MLKQKFGMIGRTAILAGWMVHKTGDKECTRSFTLDDSGAADAIAWVKGHYPHLESKTYGGERPDLLVPLLTLHENLKRKTPKLIPRGMKPYVEVIEFETDQQAIHFRNRWF